MLFTQVGYFEEYQRWKTFFPMWEWIASNSCTTNFGHCAFDLFVIYYYYLLQKR